MEELLNVDKQRLDSRSELCILQLHLAWLDSKFNEVQKELELVTKD